MKNVYATMVAVLLCASGYATDNKQTAQTEKFDAMSLITMQQMQHTNNTSAAKAMGKAAQTSGRFAATVKLAEGFDASSLTAKGFDTTPLVSRFAIVTTTIDSLKILAGYDEVDRISFAENDMNIDLSKANEVTGVSAVHQGTSSTEKARMGKGLSQSYTGKGVMIGIFDTGFDVNHAMFLDKNGKSRFKMIVYKSGAVYTDSAKIASLTTDNKYGTHATHVCGIAAGHYKGGNFEIEGVAPEADLAMGPIMSTASDLACLKKLAEYCKARGQRLVTNMSYGTMVGPHDGSDMYSQVLNELIKEYDIVACNSAGNCGDKMLVQKHTFVSSTEEMKALFDLYTSSNAVNSYITTDTSAPINMDLIVTSKSDNCQTILGRYPAIVNGEAQSVYLNDDYLNGTSVCIAKESIHDGLAGYAMTCSYVSPKNSNYRFGYIITSEEGQKVVVYNDTGKPFSTYFPEYAEGLTSNGTANSTSSASEMLVVGSYITTPSYTNLSGTTNTIANGNGKWGTTEGEVAYNSSYGTRYDGTEWPCVVAPGHYIVSAFNRYYTKTSSLVKTDTYNNATYKFCAMSGTSMASPYMAGVAALWLEANPTLTHEQIKEIAQKTADVDEYCGEGNHFYDQGKQAGAGKVNALAGIEYILSEMNEEKADTLVLDENKAMSTGCSGKKHVTLKRTFKSGIYNTVALPFDMDAAQIAATFGSDTRVYTYDPNSNEYITFHSTHSVKANKPFLMITNTTETTFEIDNVEVIEGEPVDEGIYYDFMGNYGEKMTLEKGYILLSGGKMYYSSGKNTLKGYRAYFKPASSASSAKTITMTVDGETTSIASIDAATPSAEEALYNINGQKISDNRQQNLPKGVYIQNGKKYIIK